MLGTLGCREVGGNGQQSRQRALAIPDRGEVDHGGKGSRIFTPAENFKAADPANRKAGDVLDVMFELRRHTLQVNDRRAIQARNQQLPYPFQFAFGEKVMGVELAQDLMKAIAEHPFRGGIEDEQVALQVGGQNHRAGGVQYASLQLGYLLHLPLGFILAAGVEKGVYAETDQQYLGNGPRDHGSRESPAAAQQQHQAAVSREP